MVNLDDTRHCPIGPECESCGRLDELAVLTGDTPHGIVCMTLCDACEVAGVDPIFTPAEQTARVLAHGQHVGVDVDQMTGEGDLQPPPPPRWALGRILPRLRVRVGRGQAQGMGRAQSRPPHLPGLPRGGVAGLHPRCPY